jgi:DNA polymerase-3 subunit chi
MSEAACEVWFYQLERVGLDQVLPELLEKTLARGWRALVRAASRERIEHLEQWLWVWRDDSFLAHGVDDEPGVDRQPVLLTTGEENLNAAQALFVIDGAQVGDISSFVRCVLIFDGRDEAALAQARGRWTAFKAAGSPVSYWRQGEAKGWEKQA